ncbi:MAG: hypothetical protein HON94_08475, partial [Methylococcales bacterium]|nr:hypothetical protein [Methylococcales bacterium]
FSKELFSKIDSTKIANYFDSDYFDITSLQNLIDDSSNASPLKRRLFIYLAAQECVGG